MVIPLYLFFNSLINIVYSIIKYRRIRKRIVSRIKGIKNNLLILIDRMVRTINSIGQMITASNMGCLIFWHISNYSLGLYSSKLFLDLKIPQKLISMNEFNVFFSLLFNFFIDIFFRHIPKVENAVSILNWVFSFQKSLTLLFYETFYLIAHRTHIVHVLFIFYMSSTIFKL